MKKIFTIACSLAVLFSAVSCQKDQVKDSDLVTATFVVSAPSGLATKSEIGDGSTARNLVFAVYPYDDKLTIAQNDAASELSDLRKGDWLNGAQEIVFDDQLKATVTVTLVKGRSYQFVCWAQNKDAQCFDFTDMKNIKVDYAAAKSQDELRDAFYAYSCPKDANGNAIKVTQGYTQTITLKRPFAQVNVGALDMAQAKSAGLDITNIKSDMIVKNVATSLNTFTGETSQAADASFSKMNAITGAAGTQWLKVNNPSYPDEYGWLAMNYVLPLANTNVAVEFSLYDGTREEGDDLLCSYEVPNVTVTENYRTHLLGEVLTTLGTINVIIEPAFDNEIVEGI